MATQTVPLTECVCLLPDEGEQIRIFDEEFRVKISGEATAGEYAVLVGSVAPGGGPPLHAHPSNESFYVLSGEVLFTQRTRDGVTVFRGSPGSIVHAPAGVPHRFENVSPERSKMLLTVSADMLDFLRELGAAFPPGAEPDMEKMLAIHAKHHVDTFHGEEGSRPEPSRDGATSARARALAWQFEHENAQLIETLERCNVNQWQAHCPDTGWTVAVQAHHIASNYTIIANMIRDVAMGTPHPPLPVEKLNAINARHALEAAGVSRETVIDLLKWNAPVAAATYRFLTEEGLDRTAVVTPGADAQTAAELIVAIAIGEIERHGLAIRQATGL